MGARLALGFGSLATLILVVSTMAMSAQRDAKEAAANVSDIVADAKCLEAAQRDMLMVRMNVKDFLLTNSDEDLAQYSDFAASVAKKLEAARAGEHGRGFAVVADEVRKLADRTTKATEEIADSIKAIQSETTQAVDRMNAGTDQVSAGVSKATDAGESLKKIVESAQSVATKIQSIAAAAEEQSAASEEVSRNVESISAVTKQASEGAGQAASAAAQLSAKAEQLQVLVGRFKVNEANSPNARTEYTPPGRKSRIRKEFTAHAA